MAGLSAPRFFTELIVCRGSGMIFINQVLAHFINFSKTKLGLCFIFCGGGGEALTDVKTTCNENEKFGIREKLESSVT